MRYFHDFYGVFQLASKFSATAGFDIGFEQKTKGSSSVNTWYTPVVIVRYAATDKTSIALRGEYYSDKNGVVIATGSPNGFKTWGYSANLDYSITNNAVWRNEIRNLNSKDRIFTDKNSKSVRDNLAVSTLLAINF